MSYGQGRAAGEVLALGRPLDRWLPRRLSCVPPNRARGSSRLYSSSPPLETPRRSTPASLFLDDLDERDVLGLRLWLRQ